MSKEPQNQPAPSMQDILEDLRGVISGEKKPDNLDAEMDILELTDEPTAQPSNSAAPQTSPISAPAATVKPVEVTTTTPQTNTSLPTEAVPVQLEAAVPSTEPIKAPEPPTSTPNNSPVVAEEKQKSDVVPTNTPTDIKSEMQPSVATEDNQKPAEPAITENAKLLGDKVVTESSSYIKQLVSATNVKSSSDGTLLNPNVRLEDIVRDAIKPYLVDWLEKNLPNIVKEIVTKEIKRIIPKDE